MSKATAPEQPGHVSYGDEETALRNEILRSEVGSGLHGIGIEGSDDRDEMGIFVEPKAHVYGMKPALDQYVYRTQPEGARSGPGDLDLTIYSLRKYLRLAAKGNPSALLPLFAPESGLVVQTALGWQLRQKRDLFLTQAALRQFLGYMHDQHERMLGNSKRNVPNRPELVEKYGWDVKYGSHTLRLAYQGWELAHRGTLTLPMHAPQRERVLAVKRGEVPRAEVSAEVAEIQSWIERELNGGTCKLPPEPDWAELSRFSVMAHEQHWLRGT